MFIKEGFVKEGFIRSNPSNLTNCGGNAFVKEGFVKDGFIKSDGSCSGGSSDEFIIKTITITTSNTQSQSEQKILSFLEQKETNNVKLIANLITPNAVWVIPSAFLQSKGLKTYENKSFDEEKLNQNIKEIENSLIQNTKQEIETYSTQIKKGFLNDLNKANEENTTNLKSEMQTWMNGKYNSIMRVAETNIDTRLRSATSQLENNFNIFRQTKLDLTDNELNILANKIIEILEINGKEINYSPTMASVKVFKDGTPINIPLERNKDGSLKGDMSILGDDKIYIEIK